VIRLPILIITGGLLLVVTLALLVMAFQMRYEGRILPGVSALGVDLSGMSRNEASAAIARRFNYPDETFFTLRYSDQFWQFSATDMGVSFDAEATLEEAFTGTSSTFAGRLINAGMTWLNGRAVSPVIRYDQNAAMQRLLEVAAAINRPALDAALSLDGVNVVTTPGQTGRTLDVAAALAQIDAQIMNLQPGGEITLVAAETMPTVWNVDEATGRIQAALSSPLELYADAPDGSRLGPWTASVEQIATLLQIALVDNLDGTRRYTVSIEMSVFADYLNDLAPGLITSPRDGRFHFDTTSGQLIVIQPSVSGRVLNIESTVARLQEAVFRYDSRSVPMAFDFIEPRYHDRITAAELGITQLVSEATTYYSGSTAPRIHNITEGASRFDGVIVGPGEEFSFNAILGDVSEETGFVESKVIQGERTIDGIGGGVCQVSTTVFRAAFFGGFRIIDRDAHAYRVGYYEIGSPPGLDAAIWTPDQDFRFQNDTPFHLLIEVSIFPANSAIQFRFYSTNPGRQVEVLEPVIRNQVAPLPTRYEASDELQPGQSFQIDWAAEGADVVVTRVIRDIAGNEMAREDLYSFYAPWGAVIQVAPGDTRLASTGG
jgi:vancomycin resistance protein YoaR